MPCDGCNLPVQSTACSEYYRSKCGARSLPPRGRREASAAALVPPATISSLSLRPGLRFRASDTDPDRHRRLTTSGGSTVRSQSRPPRTRNLKPHPRTPPLAGQSTHHALRWRRGSHHTTSTSTTRRVRSGSILRVRNGARDGAHDARACGCVVHRVGVGSGRSDARACALGDAAARAALNTWSVVAFHGATRAAVVSYSRVTFRCARVRGSQGHSRRKRSRVKRDRLCEFGASRNMDRLTTMMAEEPFQPVTPEVPLATCSRRTSGARGTAQLRLKCASC